MSKQSYPYRCPKCRSVGIEMVESEHEEDEFKEEYACDKCGFEWINEFEFVRWYPKEE